MSFLVTAAIVEDNQWAGTMLESYCERCGVNVVCVASDGQAFLQQYDSCKPDILFVDIRLQGELDGISMVQAIREAGGRPKVIMVSGTTNIDDVLTSFHDLGSLYFLSKPVLFPKFQTALEKAKTEIEMERSVQASQAPPATWITVKHQKLELPISEDSILYIEKEDKRLTAIHLVNGDCVEASTNLSDILLQASPLLFSPFKGFLVNMRHVASYVKERGFPTSRRFLIHFKHSTVKVPLSRNLQKEFAKLLQELNI
ncbi:LytR/AlgR family response regulator transcription factor [Paenibacillus aestuarii]|uniref:Response regulator transcription factor n=1 Tax=Paenibacillus aestuarii TaxID=516965 RepID=A0ABW0K9G0_9BACL|nr:response regulator transcription factor [Paenibacillus aestuarii]